MVPGLDKLAAEPKTEYVPKSRTLGERCSGCEHYVASEHGCDGPKMKMGVFYDILYFDDLNLGVFFSPQIPCFF